MQESLNSSPLHFLSENPSGWIRSSLSKFKNQSSEGATLNRDTLLVNQENRWVETTGVRPQDSNFTIVVPVHDEEVALPSFLGTLMLSDIPSTVNAQIVFVANACSDRSEAIIDDLLTNETSQSGDIMLSDKRNYSYRSVELGSIHMVKVSTETPGKANALTLGNILARKRGDTIVMSIDANNYVEPDAIRNMYALAHKTFEIEDENETVLFNAQQHVGIKRNRYRKALEWATPKRNIPKNSEAIDIGWFMSWDSKWLEEVGGVPNSAIEDYAMLLVAQLEEKKTAKATDVNIWGYKANNVGDLVKRWSRVYRGSLQLLQQFPHARERIEKDMYFTRDFPKRLKMLWAKIAEHPQNVPISIAHFLLWEIAIQKGRHQFESDPQNVSWEKVKSG